MTNDIKKTLPLNGIRVIDFTGNLAGPYCTMLLAFLGAEVIRVETEDRLDMLRKRDPGQFADVNVNKMAVTINLKDPRGMELAAKLIQKSQVVIESNRPGIMDKLKLGYEDVRKMKPDIIYASLTGFGSKGPERAYRAYAAIFAALGGVSNITGHYDSVPTEQRGSVDTRAGQSICFAILAAIYHWKKTGEGQFVDFAACEMVSAHIGDVLMDYIMNGRSPVPMGNRDQFMAPHNCYPCKGTDKWVSVAVGNDEEWQSLCQVMGNPEWVSDARFTDMLSRWQNQEELDRLIGQWTVNYTSYEVTTMLQKAGVAAIPSMSVDEIMHDPHLQARDFVIGWQETPKEGKRFVYTPPWKMEKTPGVVYRIAPLLGEHNRYVFGELLGVPEAEIARLEAEKVLY